TPWDMHRRWNLTVGGPRQGAAPTQVGARSPHIYCGDIAFVAGGSDRLAVLVFLEPLAIEAGPLPGFSRGNGGRWFPHSLNLLFCKRFRPSSGPPPRAASLKLR